MVERPAFPDGGEVYYIAFWDLSTCRIVGPNLMGAIPWRDIAAYADRLRLEPDISKMFVHVIRQMDEEYLQARAQQMTENAST